MKIETVLISVYDKTGIVEFAGELARLGIKILSTGGTAALLQQNSIPVIKLEEYTNLPEILDGRVKTLCYKVFSGLLCKRDNEVHIRQLSEQGISFIDMVVVNLYPFEKMMKKKLSMDEMIEYIDIGGNSLLRASAKNYKFVLPVYSQDDYTTILNHLKKDGDVPFEYRQTLAQRTFFFTSYYDSLVAGYFSTQTEKTAYPGTKSLYLRKLQDLRYGENPHQGSGLYGIMNSPVLNYAQLHGKELSFNNIADFYSAANLMAELDRCFKKAGCVIIKHRNPCGAALGESTLTAYQKALQSDPVSAYGGIAAFNSDVDLKTAREINKRFYEIVIARRFQKEALKELRQKKNLRIIQIKDYGSFLKQDLVYNSYNNLVLVQDKDVKLYKKMIPITKAGIKVKEKEELLFGWVIAKYVKSNAIVLTKSLQLIGVGAGQTSRIDSVNIAIQKARNNKFKIKGSCLASDAFFPFDDCVKLASKKGIRAIIQPGGSIHDDDVIKTAERLKMPMIFTGMRHFYH
ncbi:MAG: bifunctional phosphoribosylaminoimidazolecarboxamide formyltransferase/IMP cyclohydrolase [bacterium]|nr:bifunctional phosphoribosylaminoimidazolecarboxamide formyltransferase/IMP cyclohydrolase [bacterium]